MKVKLKAPFYDRTGLHKKNDVVEIETAAFNPYTMVEIPEARTKKVAPVEVCPAARNIGVEDILISRDSGGDLLLGAGIGVRRYLEDTLRGEIPRRSGHCSLALFESVGVTCRVYAHDIAV